MGGWWKVEGGRWKVEGGGWRVEGGNSGPKNYWNEASKINFTSYCLVDALAKSGIFIFSFLMTFRQPEALVIRQNQYRFSCHNARLHVLPKIYRQQIVVFTQKNRFQLTN